MKYIRIRNLREDHDKKQRELADFLHVSPKTYSSYENGVHQIPIDILFDIACYFHTSIDYLTGLTDEPKPYPRGKGKRCY